MIMFCLFACKECEQPSGSLLLPEAGAKSIFPPQKLSFGHPDQRFTEEDTAEAQQGEDDQRDAIGRKESEDLHQQDGHQQEGDHHDKVFVAHPLHVH